MISKYAWRSVGLTVAMGRVGSGRVSLFRLWWVWSGWVHKLMGRVGSGQLKGITSNSGSNGVTHQRQCYLLCPSLGAFLAFLNDVALDRFAAVLQGRFPRQRYWIFGRSFAFWLSWFARRVCSHQTGRNQLMSMNQEKGLKTKKTNKQRRVWIK